MAPQNPSTLHSLSTRAPRRRRSRPTVKSLFRLAPAASLLRSLAQQYLLPQVVSFVAERLSSQLKVCARKPTTNA
jgi:hypothetical protein